MIGLPGEGSEIFFGNVSFLTHFLSVSALDIERLTKVFRAPSGVEATALRSLDLQVNPGELLVLVGPSGCGKTTTLRLIAGLEKPTSGKISLHGEVINDRLPKDRDVAMVFQSHALFPHLTVWDNMAFGLKLRKFSADEIGSRVNGAAQMLGIAGKLNRRPDELSGGEAQRVALGRALVRRPKLFLLDEPLSNLDGPTRGQLRCEIAKLQGQLQTPMIYVTHDQTEALKLGHRIAVLNNGELQQVGTPSDILQRPANDFVAGFFSPEGAGS